jgi:hypothetical protein
MGVPNGLKPGRTLSKKTNGFKNLSMAELSIITSTHIGFAWR